MPNRVVAFVSAVCVAATAASLALVDAGASTSFDLLQAAFCLISLGLVADALGHEISRTTGGSTAFIPYLTAAAVAPAWPTVVGVALSVLLQGLAARRAPIKTIFNVAQSSLSIALAILTFQALSAHGDIAGRVLPYVALVTVFLVANTLTVSAVIALAERRALFEVWYISTRSTALYDLMALPFVYVFAQLYDNWGAAGVFVLAVPLLGARQLYRTNWRLEQTNQELLQLMVAAIEARDPYTSGHSQRVSRNSKIIARAIGLSQKEIERIGRAALLHDVGKIHEAFAPLLRKTSRLTPEEYALMQTHAAKSAELIQNVSYLKDLVDVVRHHHENWDGTGYPAGLAGESIPLGSRVIMVADTMDAMLTDRPYRAALTPADVTAELEKLKGRQFDPNICGLLLASPLYSRLFTYSSAPTPVSPTVVQPRLTLSRATVA
jgi:putative nucleotidyltransferase with HDIG domain